MLEFHLVFFRKAIALMSIKLIKPKQLRAGDTVATVTTSWGGPGTYPYRYSAGKIQLEENFGVDVIELPHTTKSAEWIYKNPKARADDLMQAFQDPNIDAIFSTIGGDDAIRLLPYIDFEVIQKNPKIFMGYSDFTVIHFACLKANLASFYGPSIMSGFAENCGIFPYTLESVRKTLFSNTPVGKLNAADKWTDQRLDWEDEKNQKIKRELHQALGWKFLQGEGVFNGHLIGGCFEVIETIKSTYLWPDTNIWQNAILFLEISEELPPEIIFKRGLRNYGAQGIFDQISGVLFGRPGGSLPLSEIEKYDDILTSVISDEYGAKNIPIVSQMDFGHCDPMLVMPYGANVEIDCNNQTIEILDATTI